jgi:bifunctional polynucleotide phosphatase/kinase
VFISIGSANYRKPYIGMWNRLVEQENGDVKIDKAKSFYVGDAAGRIRTDKRSKPDHSKADRLFAINAGLNFMLPENFFLKSKETEPYELPKYPDSKREPGIHYDPSEFVYEDEAAP